MEEAARQEKEQIELNRVFEVAEEKEINFHEEIHVNHNENDIADIDTNEKMIFMVLFRRLSSQNFQTLFKLFALYSNSVVSYLEFINLAESILCKIEKKLCLAFKDILEGREQSRKLLNTFAVKPNVKKIKDPAILEQYQGLNSSYKHIVHNLSSGARNPILLSIVNPFNPKASKKIVEEHKLSVDPRDNPIVNKEFYCVQLGNDANVTGNVPTKPDKKIFAEGAVAESSKHSNYVPGKLANEAEQKVKAEKLELEMNKTPYFLNVHNKNTKGISSLMNEPNESMTPIKKPKRESIYRMLALNPKFERKQAELAKAPKKNTTFQTIKRILSKTEDEKHELDIRILQFERVYLMLDELKLLIEKEEKGDTAGGTVRNRPETKLEEELPGNLVEVDNEELDINEETPAKDALAPVRAPEGGPIEVEGEGESGKKGESDEISEPKVSSYSSRAKEIFYKHFKARIEKLKKRKEDKMKLHRNCKSKKEILLERIRRQQVLKLIYDSNKRRKTKIVEILLNNLHPKILERLQQRVQEKLGTLKQIKARLSETTWKNNLINNYYKSLDVRSGCLQQNEKTFLSPKYFISNLISTEKAILEREKPRYWTRVYKPEVTLSLSLESETLKDTQNSELKNCSATFGGEDGMYDSFIKINSGTFKVEESANLLKNESGMAKSEYRLESQALGHHQGSPVSAVTQDAFITRSLQLSNSLINLLNKPSTFSHKLVYSKASARLVNPLKVFSMKDQEVIKDSIFFVKLYITFGKICPDRERNKLLGKAILSNFFVGKPAEATNLRPKIDMDSLQDSFGIENEKLIEEIISKSKKFERLLNPNKKYFLSEKMNLIKPSITKHNSEKIINFVKDLVQNKEHVAVGGFYSEQKKFFEMEKDGEKKEEGEAIEEEEVGQGEGTEGGPLESNPAPDKLDKKDSQKIHSEAEADPKKSKSKPASKKGSPSKTSPPPETKDANINEQFQEAINKSSTELSTWKDSCQETRVNLSQQSQNANRSFFGYYNFHNFFNHFIVLYERLKLMKSLTDRHGVYQFMKQVMMLNFTNVIDSELFEDVIGCMLSEYGGVFLNLEKILSNVVKEIPSQEIDRFVTGINDQLFGMSEPQQPAPEEHDEVRQFLKEKSVQNWGFPSRSNEEQWLFLKTCHKLSSLTYKSKANCKQSQIQSYINNNNLVNDHLLKFEFRASEQVFVIHKVKSLYKQEPKQSTKSSFSKFVCNSIDYLSTPIRKGIPCYLRASPQHKACFSSVASSPAQDKDEFLHIIDSKQPQVEAQTEQDKKEDKIVPEGGESENKEPVVPSESLKIQEEVLCGEVIAPALPPVATPNPISQMQGSLNLQKMKQCIAKSVFVRNEILYEYLWKYNEIKIFESRKEDKIFAHRAAPSESARKMHKLKSLQKTKKFRDLINSRLK